MRKVKLIVHETYQGKRKSEDVFAAVFLSDTATSYNIRSIDVLNLKEYNYSYEDGRIVRTTECDITLNSAEIVTQKNLVNSVIPMMPGVR